MKIRPENLVEKQGVSRSAFTSLRHTDSDAHA